MSDPGTLWSQALAAERSGNLDAARSLAQQTAQAGPNDPQLLNSMAAFHLRNGEAERAVALYRDALKAQPQNSEITINLAIALSSIGQHGAALAALRPIESSEERNARYWSVRAAAEREVGTLPAASADYDRCLALEPGHARALHGRARIALERAESDAASRFEAALAVNQGDPEIWLGYAQALEAAGNPAKAREIADILVTQAPGWIDALEYLAQLKVSAGENDFASHFASAQNQAPDQPAIALAHCRILDGLDRYREAAEVAASARRLFPHDDRFALLEAIHLGETGESDAAEAIFSALNLDTPERKLHEARHRLRRREAERAELLLADVIAAEPGNIAAWALRGIGWRVTDDPRVQWLHGQAGLVAPVEIDMNEGGLDALRQLLHRLHDQSSLPLGQSVRGGSQTRGALFARADPELADLHDAIMRALEQYRAGLPPEDANHPLLRHRNQPWRILGSWSVRLAGGGHHTGHIHPQGTVSSALYIDLPEIESRTDRAGWLHLGSAPKDLALDLPPMYEIEPQIGRLALFPSTLYHGTNRFDKGRRMTVAYDVAPGDPA